MRRYGPVSVPSQCFVPACLIGRGGVGRVGCFGDMVGQGRACLGRLCFIKCMEITGSALLLSKAGTSAGSSKISVRYVEARFARREDCDCEGPGCCLADRVLECAWQLAKLGGIRAPRPSRLSVHRDYFNVLVLRGILPLLVLSPLSLLLPVSDWVVD